MQYLARVILSGFVPQSLLERRWGKTVFVLAGAGTVILLGVIAVLLLRLRNSPAPSLPQELGLKTLRATDKNGQEWVIEPAVGQPFARLQESGLEPGPPLVLRTDMQRDRPDQVSIGLILEGRAGERYSAAIIRNGVPAPAPEFLVTDEAGKAIYKDRFKYG